MKTFWYATLVTLASLVLGTFVSNSFGGDKGFSPGGAVRRVSGPSSVAGKVSGGLSPVTGPITPPVKTLPPVVKPPIGKPPVVTIPPVVKPPIGKPPIGKPPVVTIPPIVKPPIGKPPIVGPIVPPIVKPPIKLPPIVGPFPPIKPPVKPLPPIGPKPPICPPWHPGGHCSPCLPCWWVGCYRPCVPICIVLPTYCGPAVISETVIVEEPVVTEVKVEEKLVQIPVGATLTLQDKKLGEKTGQVILQTESLSLLAKVNEWKPDEVNTTLPNFAIDAPTKAKIWLMRADGEVANMLAVELIPAKPQETETAKATVEPAAAAKAIAASPASPSDELADAGAPPTLDQLKADLQDLNLDELHR